MSDSAGITGRNTDAPPIAARGIIGALSASAAPADATARVDELAANPGNPRVDLGDLTDLAGSIAGAGLVQPLVVSTAAAWLAAHPGHDVGGARWVIIAGHRRHAAARMAGLEVVPIAVRDDLAGHATRSALIENIHRADLPPLDEAAALKALIDDGMSQRQLAKQTGISQPKISKRVALLSLPAQAKSDLAAGDLTVTDAHRLLELPDELRDATYRAVADSGRRYSLEQAVQLAKTRLAAEARHAELVAQVDAEGLRAIGDPAAEFGAGSSYAHHLWDPADITAAKHAGICVAHITRDSIEYYATTAKPWPWQPELPRPDPDDTDDGSTGAETGTDDDADAASGDAGGLDRGRSVEQAAAEAGRRLTAVHTWLHDPGVSDRDRLLALARLTAATDSGVDSESPETVSDLLEGHRDWDWTDQAAAGLAAANGSAWDGGDPVMFALAKAFSVAEWWMHPGPDAAEQSKHGVYLDVLSGIGYTPGDSAGTTRNPGDQS